MEIRTETIRDLTRISALADELEPNEFGKYYVNKIRGKIAEMSRKATRGNKGDGRVPFAVVARDTESGELVGITIGTINKRERFADIAWRLVAESARGQGVGALMLTHESQAARQQGARQIIASPDTDEVELSLIRRGYRQGKDGNMILDL